MSDEITTPEALDALPVGSVVAAEVETVARIVEFYATNRPPLAARLADPRGAWRDHYLDAARQIIIVLRGPDRLSDLAAEVEPVPPSDDLRASVTAAIRGVTDGWDEPLDEVHDVPPIVNAILALLAGREADR